MNDLLSVVDWSRAQFALTAMYHWLFVPLTIGLALIVAIMETIYVRTGKEYWKNITKFWMTLFGINFAVGVATGLILEFEFGTNWSNYSWFVGDIFGAPLAIEGIVAFFMEATFVAVMFFGWNKVSKGFHLASTWLTALGVCLSAMWILIANAWMQYPVGMEFDPSQMRNVMDDFFAVALSPVAVNKFCHTVSSSWVTGGVFVVGVSCWLLWKRRNIAVAKSSIKIGAVVGLVGILAVLMTGHGSAVVVSKVQPMKLAAMEGLYEGSTGQSIVAFGVLKPDAAETPADPMAFSIDIPKGLSYLIYGNGDSYVPGINDLIEGRTADADGKLVEGPSYAEKIADGMKVRTALAEYGEAMKTGNEAAMAASAKIVKDNFDNFGYGYLDSPEDGVPPVGMTFYAFHIMVFAGGFLFLFLIFVAVTAFNRDKYLEKTWLCLLGMLSIAIVWVCSESGWVLAEVGRQPWVIQNLMPRTAAISGIQPVSVQITFWVFAFVFTALLIAEISIMLRYISRASKTDIATTH